jgi:signal transduction histidine kinase
MLEYAELGVDRLELQEALPVVVATLLVVIVGFVVADRRSRSAALRDRAEFLEREREALSRQAVAEERLRIARELHDLVAHSLTTIAIQSSTGRLALPYHPDVALHALATIETTSRDATREMRQLLGVLRQADDTTADLDPPPGLDNLDALVDGIRHAGVTVQVRIEGTPKPLSKGLDLVAYRVVQEALTNVAKHAGATRVTVTLRRQRQHLTLAICDNGRGIAPADRLKPASFGLRGMSERARALGGTLTLSAAPGGGTMVTIKIRLAPPPARSA